MKFKLIVIGKIKEKALKQMVDEYIKRISGYASIEIKELDDEIIKSNPNNAEIEIVKKKESEKVLKFVSDRDHLVLFDLNQKELTSEGFATFFKQKFDNFNGHLVFAIGGSYGFDDIIKSRANDSVSLSKMTFPHQLFRLIALEQIYRAFKINNNEVYHK